MNDVVHGTYLLPSKSVLSSSSLPESFGTSTPGEPLVGAAFQSAATLTTAGTAGAAEAGGASAAAGAAGAPGAGGGGEAQVATNIETTTKRPTGANRR